MEKNQRGNFSSKIGVILATAGSAVGLGNIWRFPFMTGENGGAAFVLIYFVCILLLGLPGMLNEFIIGRRSASNAARAYMAISNGNRFFGWLGYLGAFTSMIILGFYSVVAGWCLQYLYASIVGELNGDSQFAQNYFAEFSQSTFLPIILAVVFIILTHLIVVKGIKNGIEKASKILMPLLFILLIVLAIASCSLPGAVAGIEFLFKPDFSKVTSDVFLDALGQAFFSLSLGTACLCTYASYFSKKTNLVKSATQIALIDSFVAILAGLMIFPAAFAVGVRPDSGPSLIFITLPAVFQEAFASIPTLGYVISILFYLLLVLAALTSTISMHEIGTALFHEELKLSRNKGAWIETIVCCVIAILCALSCGAAPALQLFDMKFIDFCDFITAKFFMPAAAFFTCFLLGWVVPKKVAKEELTNNGKLKGTIFPIYLFLIRYVVPLCIFAIFLKEMNWL